MAETRAFLTAVADRLPARLENLVALPVIDSTNRLARRLAEEILDEGADLGPTLVLAYEQTAGRGRRGKRWASAPGRGLYASFTWTVEDATRARDLPLAVAAAVAERLNEVLGGERCGLKWPNDLLVDGAKIGGVLVETFGGGDGPAAVVVGVGVNLLHGASDLPSAHATSLRLLSEGEPDAVGVWVALLEAVLAAVTDEPSSEGLARRYRELTVHRDGDALHCHTGGETVDGLFRGFDDSGRLRLEVEGEIRLLASGAIETR